MSRHGAPGGAAAARTPATTRRGVAPSPPPGGGAARAWTFGRWTLFAVLLGYAVVGRVRYFDWCVHDDAFISFRYARNLVRGDGLVMNAGERVEGITNFLWTLLAAPAIAAHGDPAWFAQALGAGLALTLMTAAFLFSEWRLGAGWFALVTPAFLAFNLAFLMESLSGLETMAFALLVFAAYVAFLEERRGGRPRAGLWAALCGAATLVRPEGALVFVVLATYAGLGVRRGEPAGPLLRAGFLYAALVVPLFVWRLAYYGAWLPNTFHAKVGFTSAQVARGWRFTVHVLAYTLTRPLLAAAAMSTLGALLWPVRVSGVPPAASDRTRLLARRPRDEALAVALLLAVAYALYVLLVGGDYEPTARFYMPVLVLIYLLFQEGLRTAMLWVAPRGGLVRAAAPLVALAVAVACLLQSEARFLTVLQRRGWPDVRRQHHAELRAVGEWLRDHTSPGTVLAFAGIGALPYYADRPVIDLMGLTDRHIGRRQMSDMGQGPAGHEKGDGAYVLGRRPDIILFDKGHLFPAQVELDAVLAQARGISELEIARSPVFAREYELQRARTPVGILHYFTRRR